MSLLFIAACSQPSADAEADAATTNIDYVGDSRSTVLDLKEALSSELQTAMQAAGIGAAIEVCRSLAQPITADISGRDAEKTIRRVALRYRNPANAADELSKSVMEQWIADLDDQQAAKPVVNQTMDSVIVHHPIILGANCLACHGDPDNFHPEVTKALSANYPNDNATGFEVGELRGAFRVEYTN
jgi:hypothetical protein